MPKPTEDLRNELVPIVKKVIEENFDVEDYITESVDVVIAVPGHSIATVHLNGLFLGAFRLEELYEQAEPMIFYTIARKIAHHGCNDIHGLFAISVLR